MDADTADIDAQIAALQAARQRKLDEAEAARREREAVEAKVLVGSTPTKRKPAYVPLDESISKPAQPKFEAAPRPAKQVPKPTSSHPPPTQSASTLARPATSTMSSSLAALRRTTSSSSKSRPAAPRSSSFAERPRSSSKKAEREEWDEELEVDDPGRIRRSDLTILENILPGPKEFGRDHQGGDEWPDFEPNSSVRLSERVLSHEELQDHLRGRYFLPPPLLYSVIRLSRDGATYDVPVEGDWVTIAVVAERGEVRVSGRKKDHLLSDDDEDVGNAPTRQGDKPKSKEEMERDKWKKARGPRKYINIKLCTLPPRSSTLGTNAASVGGDALLQLLLFESDSIVREKDGGTLYRGGSGGAYEKWCNLTVGSVIALLNPRVLRPLRSGGSAPHPLSLPLALNPSSTDGITLIGTAKDLGQCSANQKDGKRCKTWVDLRLGQVCEYHVHAAVQRSRAGRAEFTASTSSFSLQSRGGINPSGPHTKYDPRRKQGLLPVNGAQAAPKGLDNGGGGMTYVVGGNTISMSSSGRTPLGFGEEHISEKLGRARASKRKRAEDAKEAEKALESLLERDRGGGGSTGAKYLAALKVSTDGKGLGAKGKSSAKGGGSTSGSASAGGGGSQEGERKRPFSAAAVKRIGFDPTSRPGARLPDDEEKKRLNAIASLKDPDRTFSLARPKGLGRSNVRAPPARKFASPPEALDQGPDPGDEDMIDLD